MSWISSDRRSLPGVIAHQALDDDGGSYLAIGPAASPELPSIDVTRNGNDLQAGADGSIVTSGSQQAEVMLVLTALLPNTEYVRDDTAFARKIRGSRTPVHIARDTRVVVYLPELRAALGYDPATALNALLAAGTLTIPVRGDYLDVDPHEERLPLSGVKASQTVYKVVNP